MSPIYSILVPQTIMSVFLKRTDAFPGWKRKRRALGVGGGNGGEGLGGEDGGVEAAARM